MMHQKKNNNNKNMLVANRTSTEVIDLFIDMNKGTVSLSSVLFPFFCIYIVLPFSQSSNLGGSPKPVACKIAHGHIK